MDAISSFILKGMSPQLIVADIKRSIKFYRISPKIWGDKKIE
jgi:hypothetical protein